MSSKIGRFPLWFVLIVIVFVIGVALVFFIRRGLPLMPDGSQSTTANIPASAAQSNQAASDEVDPAAYSIGSRNSGSLHLVLSEGHDVVQVVETVPVVTGEPLSEADARQIINRLPTITAVSDDELDFRLPDAPIPRPRTGDIIDQPFPPPASQAAPEPVHTEPLSVLSAPDAASPTLRSDEATEQFSPSPTVQATPEPAEMETAAAPNTPGPTPGADVIDGQSALPEPAETGPLAVLRYSPEGELPTVPFVNVTFSQPMVSLTGVEKLAAADAPVTISPELPGTWTWLSPQDLRFEYGDGAADRFPKATDYTVTILAGAESATGNKLAETVTWTFSTPALKLTSAYPNSGVYPLNPLILAAFDQKIDPEAVLARISVTANGRSVPVRLATEAEIEADGRIKQMVGNGRAAYSLVFRAEQPLPANAQILVTILPGTPSSEGPRLTTAGQSFSFLTYAPLQITDHGCAESGDSCPPLTPFVITFNNPLDASAYTEEMLQISPALPGAYVDISGSTLTIRGTSAGNTTYRIRVAGAIQDMYGQKLGQDETLTFKVGFAADTRPQALSGPNQQLITLDPSANPPVFTIYSLNYKKVKVRIYAVDPEDDWQEYLAYRKRFNSDEPLPPPGKRVMSRTIRIDGQPDVITETAIDLSDALAGETGHLLVIVEPPWFLIHNQAVRRRAIQAWVQVTQIGIDTLTDHSAMLAWTTNLQDGAPLSGVSISALGQYVQATTDGDGLARFALGGRPLKLLIARSGDDSAIMPSNAQAASVRDELRWYLFDDRQMYRPGEEVHVKGWLRQVGSKQGGDVSLVGESLTAVSYRVIGPQGNELHTGSVDVNAMGGFDLAFTLPENVNLGHARLLLQVNGDLNYLEKNSYQHSFQIQEFRRPEFEVKTQKETAGPYVINEQAIIAVAANYYAGGPLPNAEVTWNVTYTPAAYTPPNWSGFTFGQWIPWWWYDYEPPADSQQTTFTGVTDGAGKHYLQLGFEIAYPDSATQNNEPLPLVRPYTVSAHVTVMDTNRQAWSSHTNLLVHPSDLYVGLRSERSFVPQGQPLAIEAVVTDVAGAAVAGQAIQVTAVTEEWQQAEAEGWVLAGVNVQECRVTSETEPVFCSFNTEKGGTYQITAVVTDDQGRPNESRLTRWVSGGQRPASNRVAQETVTLIPDRETYQPGDTAEILVQPPFSPAEALLTVSRNGILYTEQFRIEEDSYTLHVPISESHVPNLFVQVDLVGSVPRTDGADAGLSTLPPRPAYAGGSLKLDVPPYTRTLSLTVEPRDAALEPGGETAVDVTVTDAGGRPAAGAELAVVVVDEAVLALTNYQLRDPLSVFYGQRPSWVSGSHSRANIILIDPHSLLEQIRAAETAGKAAETVIVVEEGVMMEAEILAEEPAPNQNSEDDTPIPVRSNFDPLAAFAPAAYTDGNGRATVAVNLPDNLTRYRIMVVAVADGDQFGVGESSLTARLPLMVRPAAPRFLNFGDQFEFPVLLQNQTDQPLSVDVVLQTTNLTLTGNTGWRVTVPANDRLEVRFPAAAAMAGTARYQVAAVSGLYADAAVGELPVYTPATTETFAAYGVVDEGAVTQPLALPGEIIPQFGGLEITTSSTALQSLTDAVIYLVNCEYTSSEQLASRILAIAALRDVLSAFEADGLPTPSEMETAVPLYIERLQGMQNRDGGFPIWERGKESVPFHSIHVAHALARARQKSFDVPENMIRRVNDYLISVENRYPAEYSQKTRRALSAYAIYVRDLLGDSDPAKARALYEEAGLENLSLEALTWLWQVMADDANSAAEVAAIRRHINNRAVETAGAANFTTSYGDDAYLMLHSDRRTDGVILEALIAHDPENDLIPKVVNGLLAHRTRGRWRNTQENVFILLALDRYFNTYEKETPDFVARIWLGEDYVAEHAFEGRSTDSLRTSVPMSYLTDVLTPVGGTEALTLVKEGNGRLYYRFGLNYAPADLDIDPLDRGFIVQRSYAAVDDPEDVVQDENGVWHIKAGARVRVNLTLITNNRRYHVALLDPLPAGLEIVNPALAVSGPPPSNSARPEPARWWGAWYQHQNMRDERAEVFSVLLWEGVYQYSYTARATTPGMFVAPPAKAEEMYSPEVFGRSGSDWVIVEVIIQSRP